MSEQAPQPQPEAIPVRFSSQHGEDRWILENLKPEPGFFLDVGAFDGVVCSNTLAFEDLGWHGICVEPDPIMAAACTTARKCQTLCAAVGDTLTNPIAFFVNEVDRGLSSLRSKPSAVSEKDILVPVVTLNALIACCPKFQCDLLSIDTEGTELDVWRSGRNRMPRIIIIEYQTSEEPSREVVLINQLVKVDQYQLVHRTPHNLILAR